jgi:sugar lactone lactonase YvrE
MRTCWFALCARRGLAIDGEELFVADSRNHRIVVYSLAKAANGEVQPARCYGGGESSTRGRFGLPSGVCIANGRLYVTELTNHRVQVLSLDRGLPLQVLKADGPVSGVCADSTHVCTTSLDGDHAITLWRVNATPRSSSMMMASGRGLIPP